MLVDSSGTRTQHSYEHHSVSFAAYLTACSMFSRAWHYEPVFPPSALATFSDALRWLNVSHALHWLHVFPRFLDTGYMFSHACLALFTCLPMNIENYFFYCDTVKLIESKLTLTLFPNPA